MLITLNILLVLLRCLAALPLKVLYTFTGFVSWLLRVVFRYRREVVTVNLARSFPDKSYEEIRQLSKQFYRHLGEIFAETLWFGGCRKGERFRRQGLVVETNPELLDTLKGERGALVMTSHCGNWELLGGMMEYDPREGASRPYAAADVVVVYNQAYDDAIHDTVPESPEALAAACAHADAFVRLVKCAVAHWRGHRALIAWAPDHGCHMDWDGHGNHGEYRDEDINVVHLFGALPRALGQTV